MSTPQSVHAPTLAQPGEPCPRCSAPLAPDQRYCLECGTRRAEARLPFLDVLGERGAVRAAPAAPPERRRLSEIGGGTAALGVALAVLFLAVGVLVGRSGGGKTSASGPAVVTVGGGAGATGGAGGTGSQVAFKSDWPAGQSGWTVQLQTLPKSSNDPAKVAVAKSGATSKGAPAVGALDSDDFASLTPGQYVVYSGRFKTKAEATKALGSLKKSFPGAKVVQISATGGGGAGPAIDSAKAKQDKQQLQQLQNLSGGDYSKQSRKLPKTVELPGKAPPKDNKQGGGGSGFQTIN